MMKKLLFLFLLNSIVVSGQEFTHVDNIVKSYPKYRLPQQLADRISKDFSSDLEKVRASFKWITNNIRYNLEEAQQPNRTVIQFRYSSEKERLEKIQQIKDNIVKEAFFSKKGVCEEYAQSLKKLCDLLGIEAEVLTGYVRNTAYEINRVPNTSNHVWNAVKIDNKWILIDATWSSGHVINGRWLKEFNNYYFNIDHHKIKYTHYTDDRKWNVILNQDTLQEFYSQPIYGKEFLRKNMEVISPKNGTIITTVGETIILKIKNLKPHNRVYYGLMGDQYSKKPIVTFNNNIASISIVAPVKNIELYIFVDKEMALEYKIVTR